MESQESRKVELPQGSFEKELEKIFFALKSADKAGRGRDYYPGVNLFLSTLCFNACGDDNDTWLSVTPPTSNHTQHYKDADFTIDLAHVSRETAGRELTTTPILLINCMGSGFGETDEEESQLYARLRSQVSVRFDEMRGLGTMRDLSTLSLLGETWRWDDWSCTPIDLAPPIRMEMGRGPSVIRARKMFGSGIEAYKAWEIPTPIGPEIDPKFLDLWVELLEKHSLQPRVFTHESQHRSDSE